MLQTQRKDSNKEPEQLNKTSLLMFYQSQKKTFKAGQWDYSPISNFSGTTLYIFQRFHFVIDMKM